MGRVESSSHLHTPWLGPGIHKKVSTSQAGTWRAHQEQTLLQPHSTASGIQPQETAIR